MEYMGDKTYWDSKVEIRGDSLLSPEKALINNIGYLKKGTVLDVACGDGRNTLYLLQKGFDVIGVDFSNKALERLNAFATRAGYEIETKQVDLSGSNSLNELNNFDNIVINHYRANKEVLKEISKHINDDGILFVCGFGHKHKVDSKIRQEDLILESDFEEIKNMFDLIKYEENEDERGFFVTYIFKKVLVY